MTTRPKRWKNVLQLDSQRNIIGGSQDALSDAIGRGSDLRIYTQFRYNEHIDVASSSDELIEEVAEFGVTYLIDNRWSAGIMNLRQPIEVPVGFGSRPSMSFFLYNQDGQQAIARPYLDGVPAKGSIGASPLETVPGMRKFHSRSNWDCQTNAPSNNFICDFETYRFFVRDDWQEVLAHDADGQVVSGFIEELAEAAADGCQLKVGVSGLCNDLHQGSERVGHEVFVQIGSCYFCTEQQFMVAGSHPLVRVKPQAPMLYESRGWDFGWLMLRSDGQAVYRRCDPYTLAFEDVPGRYGIRWFVR